MSLHNFLFFHLRSHIKNACFVFHQGFQTPRNNQKTRPAASCFHYFLGVWNPWWNTRTRFWYITSKSIQTSLTLRKHPPKPYKLLNFFISFVTTAKTCHAPSVWKKMRWKSLCFLILKSITEIIKKFKSLYDFGWRCLKIRDVCIDFEPYSRSIIWSLFILKASYLVKWPISTWSLMWRCQFID